MNGRRKSVFKDFEADSKIHIMTGAHPFSFRDNYTSEARYGLSIGCGDNERMINPFRIYYFMANGVHVISDSNIENDQDGYLDDCIVVPTSLLGDAISQAQPSREGIIEVSKRFKLVDSVRDALERI